MSSNPLRLDPQFIVRPLPLSQFRHICIAFTYFKLLSSQWPPQFKNFVWVANSLLIRPPAVRDGGVVNNVSSRNGKYTDLCQYPLTVPEGMLIQFICCPRDSDHFSSIPNSLQSSKKTLKWGLTLTKLQQKHIRYH